MNSPTDTIAAPEPTPLVALFQSKDIRIGGTVHSPLFCAQDVAKKIGDDVNYRRTLSEYDEEDACDIPAKNARGALRTMRMLTETGLYRYLLGSRSSEAKPFQKWARKTLVEIRMQLVDSAQLATKIAEDRCRILEGTCAFYKQENINIAKECSHLRRIKKPDGFHASEDCRPDDLRSYCLGRYFRDYPKHPRAEITPHVSKVIDDISYDFYYAGYYERCFDEIQFLLNKHYGLKGQGPLKDDPLIKQPNALEITHVRQPLY
jgi:hypothetical protein